MANFRQIHVSTWKDPWFLELDPLEKVLFIYLFSNESTSLAGIYEISFRVICFETGLEPEFVKKALAKFAEDDKVFYEDGIIWVKNLRKYNASSSEKVQIRIRGDVAKIPECPIKQRYISYYNPNIPYTDPTDTLSLEEEEEEEMKKNEEEKEKEISQPQPLFYPSNSGEAIKHPDLQLVNSICGVWPGSFDWSPVIDSVQHLRGKYPRDQDLVEYMTPYWTAWSGRKTKNGRPYKTTNFTWLTEWAVLEQIPKAGEQVSPKGMPGVFIGPENE
jgi:hypothetical protein